MVGSTATWRGGLYPSFCISRRHKNLYHRQPPSIHHYTGSGTVRHGTAHHTTPQHTTPHHAALRHAVSLRARAPRPFAATDQRFHHPTEHLLSRSSRDLFTPVASRPSVPFPHSPFHRPRPTSEPKPGGAPREYPYRRLSLSPITPCIAGWMDRWMDGWG